nr:glycosyltransferase [Arenivirga flava]
MGIRFSPTDLSRPEDVTVFGESVYERLLRAAFVRTGRSRRVKGVLRSWRPDVIHAHFLPNAWRVSRAAEDLGIPLVVTLHGHDATAWPGQTGLRGALARSRARRTLARAALVIAVSEHIKQRAIGLGATPDRVVVHHIGVPLRASVAARNIVWDVIFVGRFVEKKGLIELLEAVELLAERAPLRVALIGDGPMKDEVAKKAAASRANIILLGALSPAEVAHHLAASRMLVAPSKQASDGDCEGLPTVVVEAAAAALPVVATLHSGIPEAVLDGRTGLLSPEGDVARLAANIMMLFENHNLASDLGRQGRAFVENAFDMSKQTAILETYYEDISAGASR